VLAPGWKIERFRYATDSISRHVISRLISLNRYEHDARNGHNSPAGWNIRNAANTRIWHHSGARSRSAVKMFDLGTRQAITRTFGARATKRPRPTHRRTPSRLRLVTKALSPSPTGRVKSARSDFPADAIKNRSPQNFLFKKSRKALRAAG